MNRDAARIMKTFLTLAHTVALGKLDLTWQNQPVAEKYCLTAVARHDTLEWRAKY